MAGIVAMARLVAGWLLSGPVCALQGAGEAPTQLQPIVVPGELVERSVTQVDRGAYTGFARSIARAAFAARFVEMSTLLDALPGLQARRPGGLGSFSSLSLRGAGDKQLNIFLDGVLLNDPSTGIAEVNQLPAAAVERIDVYPDITPAALSSANLAGAVNVVSRSPAQEEWSGELLGSLGSFSSRHAEASLWGGLGDWSLLGTVHRTRAENDFPVDDALFRTRSGRRRNDGYAADGALLSVARRWGGARLQLLAQHGLSHKQLPTALNRRRDAARLSTRRQRLQLVMDHRLGAVALGHRLVHLRGQELFDDRADTLGLGADWIDSRHRAWGMFHVATFAMDRHEISLGLDVRQDELRQHDRLEDQPSRHARRRAAALVLADAWAPAPRWQLAGSLRYRQVRDQVLDWRQARQRDTSRVNAAALGLRWRAAPALAVKANLGRNVRIPTLGEKFGARGLFEGDPELRHERSTSLDAGLEFATAAGRAVLSAFAADVDDAIVTIFDSRGIGQPRNIGAARRRGLELDARYAPAGWWQMRLAATLMNSENRSRIASARGQRLPGIYHQRAAAGVTLFAGRARWSIDLRHSDQLFYDTANGVSAGARTDIDTAVAIDWRGCTLHLSASNLLDENFQDINRFPVPGRAWQASLSATFD